MSGNKRSKSVSSQRSELDSPAKPEHEETGPICSGRSQNVPLSTWGTFDASDCTEEGAQAEECVKKEKDKKSLYKKIRKGIKKRMGKKSSDHAGKKEEKISDEYEEEELSEATLAEHEEVQSHGDHSYLPGEDEDHISTPPTKESLGAKLESSRCADELEQRRHEIQTEVGQLEKDKREFNARMEIWNVESRKEKETLEQRNRELEEGLANSTRELKSSRLELEEEMEDLRQKKIEWENKEKEMHKRHEFEIHELETNNQVLEKKLIDGNVRFEQMEQELADTIKKLDNVGGEVKMHETELDDTRMQNDHLHHRNIELCHNIETMETSLRDMEKKMQEKENELKKVEDELKTQNEEMLAVYKDHRTAIKKHEDALNREKLSQVKEMELESEVKKLENKLDLKIRRDQSNQEQNLAYLTLEKTAKHWESKFGESQMDLMQERESFTLLEETLEKTKNELSQKELLFNKQKGECDTLQAAIDELNIQLEEAQKECQNVSQMFEQERKKWLFNQEEMKVTQESNAVLKQQLGEHQARYAVLDKGVLLPPYVPKQDEGSISMPERNILEAAHELQLKKQLSSTARQKSVELLPGSLMQVDPDVSMHSSAPSSLMKEKYSPGDLKRNEDVSVVHWKSEEEEFKLTYESPHTSLTEVVGSVTVNEDNMTDAVKINIQHEVAVLQEKMQHLREENDHLLSELEAMKTERAKLFKIKDKYFSLVGERATMFQKLQEAESQFKVKGDQAADHDDPNVQMSINATEVNLHPKEDDITIEKIIQEKDMEIFILKTQLQALDRKTSKAKLDQMEIHSEEGTVEPSELKEVAETLTFELKSIKRQLTRAESEHSDISMEKSALSKEMKKLEEENLQLQTETAQHKEKSEFWQQKCENEGIECKTAAQTAELNVNLLQIELEELKTKFLRKENEVQTMAECREKLEERLLITRQERDRQHHQITSLLALKANLTEELDRYGLYAQDLGQFKEKSQQFKKVLAMRTAEVAGLKAEKAALVKEMDSMKDEIETRKLEVSIIRKDFEEERKDRERMASDIDIEKGKWEVITQELVDAVEKEKLQSEYMETQLKKARVTWNTKRSEYENEISALSDQVELLQTKVEELSLSIDQSKKEYDAKLTVTEGRLLKERQKREQTLQELSQVTQKREQTLKELNRVTELMQCSQQEFNSRQAEANAIHKELKLNLEVMSTDRSSIDEELRQLQEEMHTKKSQYESEKNTAEKKINKLYEYSDQLQQTVAILESEKDVLKEETEKVKQEENRKLISIQHDLEMKLEESKQHYGKEKQLLTNKLKSLEMLRRTMKSQLDEEKQRADENCNNLSKLSRELVTKDQVINQYQKELQFIQDRLHSMEYTQAKYESDIQDLNIYKVKLERVIDQLRSQAMGGGDHTEDYLRLNEIERQRADYEAKFSTLMDDYSDLRTIAIQNGLKVPQRRNEDASQYPNRPARSDPPYVVQPFNSEAYNLQSSHNPIEEQRRARTEYASGHGPTYPSHSEPPMPHSPYLAGSHSPRARVRRGSHDPSDGLRHGNAIRENELIDNIDDDITEAAANMEEKVIETSLVSKDDARPLDSNLICPLCGRQYRIGQIQHYKHHVDNCNYKQI